MAIGTPATTEAFNAMRHRNAEMSTVKPGHISVGRSAYAGDVQHLHPLGSIASQEYRYYVERVQSSPLPDWMLCLMCSAYRGVPDRQVQWDIIRWLHHTARKPVWSEEANSALANGTYAAARRT